MSAAILTSYEKYEQYWQILKNNQEMIRFSEVKAGLAISIYGILFGVILNSVDWLTEQMPTWNVAQIGIMTTFMISTFVALYYAFRCFMPRFENKNPTSVIYFGDVTSDFCEYQEYHTYLEKIVVDDSEISVQAAEQIHTNSCIATRKMRAVNMAMRVTMLNIVILIVLVGNMPGRAAST